MGYTKDQLLSRLRELEIEFACYDHPVVLTVEAQAKYVGHLGGGLSKNLLLKDKKHRFYVISALVDTKVDLKVLSQRLGLGKGGLRMAPEDALQEILQVPLGSVTPFALINDSARTVSLLLDQGFKSQECCYFHPLSNDMTISLSASSVDKFLTSVGRKPSYVDLEANPAVGKDSPPDLAAFVPSDVPNLPELSEKAIPTQLPAKAYIPKENSNSNEVVVKPNVQKVTTEKPQKCVDALAEVTDVSKFVEEIINKTSAAVMLELSKNSNDRREELGSSVLEGVRKRITSDLENLAMSFKNTAYTQGYHSGVQSFSSQIFRRSF